MKKIIVISLFLLLSTLLYIAEGGIPNLNSTSIENESTYDNGILKSESNNLLLTSNYKIDAELIPESQNLKVKEEITWINKTTFPTYEIYFHLYANGYKSKNTLFAQGYNIGAPETLTEIKIEKILVDGIPYKLEYVNNESPNSHDSTVAKATLNRTIMPGDSIKIYFEYSLKVPLSVKRFGYAAGRNFFFISQWFPKVGVFENGKWICSPYYPYLNFYSDFGKYDVSITLPENYEIASTGVETKIQSEGNLKTYSFTQKGVHDFAWCASDEILKRNSVYTRKDGSQVLIQAFVQPEREKYFDRYFECVKNSLEYFEENIGVYPYQNISLVDVPRTSGAGGMEYPTLFTVSADLFSPKETGWPEFLVAHEFSHQFFQGILANNEVYEAWLDEGFASFAASKIMYKYYPDIYQNFRIASYIPVFGLNFLSYNDIPIIYTLVDVHIPIGSRSVSNYYNNLNIGTLADTSYKLPTRLSYVVNAYSKPELVLLTLDRYLGSELMSKILKEYYKNYRYKHPTSKNFIDIVQRNTDEDISWFFNEFYNSSKVFDYSIKYVKKIDRGEYEVLAERLGDGVFKNYVVLYTDKETLKQKWDGSEKWKVFRFKTEHEVFAAAIDPERINLLDLNFANNSYTVNQNIWASLSLATRWFFWVQNALMILGSTG